VVVFFLPRAPRRLHPVVLVLSAVDAAAEGVLAQVVPLDRLLVVLHGAVAMVADVVVDHVTFLVGRTRRSLRPLSRLALGAGRADLSD
jgi:hypothetical protein